MNRKKKKKKRPRVRLPKAGLRSKVYGSRTSRQEPEGLAPFSSELPYVVRPDERLVTFFFRMHESLGWPVDDSIQMTEMVHPRFHAFLEELIGGHLDMPSPEMMLASILFHEVPENVSESSSLAAVMRAFARGFPLDETEDQTDERGHHPELDGTWADVTVAEVVVPLKAIYALEKFKEGSAATEGLPDLTEPPQQLISEAMDYALVATRNLQSMHVAALRRPLKLLTREQLPAMVPYGLRDANKSPRAGGTAGFMLVNDRFERFGSSGQLSPEQRASVMRTRDQPGRIRAYTDLYNQASVGLRVEGNTRECAVMAGAASEAFCNLLVLLLRWEAGLTPEQSAQSWPESLITRIRVDLPPRVGGNWAPTGMGPYAAWYRSIYELRNRVAHAGYEPSTEDCEGALAALDGLITDVGVRLTSGQRLMQFPRVATMLFGPRLEPRLPKLPWLNAMQSDPTEVHWIETSGRWIDTHYRLVRDAVEPRSPKLSQAELHSMWPIGSSSPVAWVVIDQTTGLAAEATVDPERVVMPNSALPTAPAEADATDLPPYVVAHARRIGDVVGTGPWVEQYHLNHLLAVMADRSDGEQPWPVHPLHSPMT